MKTPIARMQKKQVVGGGGKENPSWFTPPVIAAGLTILVAPLIESCENLITHQGSSYTTQNRETFNNKTSGLQEREKNLIQSCIVASTVLVETNLNGPSKITGNTFAAVDTTLIKYGVQNETTKEAGDFEVCVNNIQVADQFGGTNLVESSIMTFFDQDQKPKSYQHDPKMLTRDDTGDHTMIGIQGKDVQGNEATIMIITVPKLSTNADLNLALRDFSNILEVELFNPTTKQRVIIPQQDPSQLPVGESEQASLNIPIMGLLGVVVNLDQVIIPAATPTIAEAPATATVEATAIATATAIPATMEELGVTDTTLTEAFDGIGKFLTPEGGKFIATIDGEKYTLDGGWNLNVEQIKTVNAVDQQGNRITLIWNKEGLSINSPLSTDIENPTEFDDTNKLTMSQKFKLQNPDPFSKRMGLITRVELTERGRVFFLKPDNSGDQSTLSNVWLRYTDLNGKVSLVNPMDLNDIDARKIIMCDFGKASTEKTVLEQFIKYLKETKVIWPILKADESFFSNFQHTSSPVAPADEPDLFNLLKQVKIEDLPSIAHIITGDFNDSRIDPTNTVNNGNYVARALTGDGFAIAVDPAIQEMIIPCLIK